MTGLYEMILDEFAVVATAHSSENELGCAAHATRSLLAPRPADGLRRERLDQRLRTLGAGDETSVFRDDPGALLAHAPWLTDSPALLLHEGYMVDPVAEGSAEIEKLRIDLGDRFWATSPDVWDEWGKKGRFRARCRDLLGELSVPPGIESSAAESEEVIDVVARFDAGPATTMILKLPGGGGQGNLVLGPEASDDRSDRIRDLWNGIEHPPKRSDVVVEEWLPWDSTYSVSFLIDRERVPTLVADCEQTVEPTRGAWSGARSHGPLDAADRSAMLGKLRTVFNAMAADGYVGVAALDVIVGSGTGWSGHGLDLPSGQRMCVIECNPRFNQHNRIGLVVERLARRWRIPSRELSWSLRNIDLPEGTTLAALLASLEGGGPGVGTAPTRGRPATIAFAHRFDMAMELTISRAV